MSKQLVCMVLYIFSKPVNGSCGPKSVNRETKRDHNCFFMYLKKRETTGDNGRQCEITTVPSCI